ncbi:hypothetical protein HYH03_016638 [Edaphochlamys debaryana]|uniref:glutathione transferase n=1 Tax=Edaphochlamys debaryana TaxID=47281 RepID=A0A835XK11_9CHLO|nr:hypothetical protein HYH03_016638 [Edaphochlamys debaryana]|eukprot:KAG2484597.1 hypothetical protein HYH03_016638 [Edaphochlamys debaryana]
MCAVDMIMEGVESLRVKYVNLIYNDKLEEAAKKKYWELYFDKNTSEGRNGGAHVTYLLNFLKKSTSGFMAGEGLTLADLAVWEITDLHLRIFEKELKDSYPELMTFQAKIADLPGIKEYLAGPKRLAAPNANNLG